MPNASQEHKSSRKELANIAMNSLETAVLAFRPAHLGLSDLVYAVLLFMVYIPMPAVNWCISNLFKLN